jgi:hypothetical protein
MLVCEDCGADRCDHVTAGLVSVEIVSAAEVQGLRHLTADEVTPEHAAAVVDFIHTQWRTWDATDHERALVSAIEAGNKERTAAAWNALFGARRAA